MRKYLSSLFLLLALAPAASAQIDPAGPFTATASGTALAQFTLQTASGTQTGVSLTRVTLDFHRSTLGGNVIGNFRLDDLTRGTRVTSQMQAFTALLLAGPIPGNESLQLSGRAHINQDPVLGNDKVGDYLIQLMEGTSPNFGISISSQTFNLAYEFVTLPVVSIQPG